MTSRHAVRQFDRLLLNPQLPMEQIFASADPPPVSHAAGVDDGDPLGMEDSRTSLRTAFCSSFATLAPGEVPVMVGPDRGFSDNKLQPPAERGGRFRLRIRFGGLSRAEAENGERRKARDGWGRGRMRVKREARDRCTAGGAGGVRAGEAMTDASSSSARPALHTDGVLAPGPLDGDPDPPRTSPEVWESRDRFCRKGSRAKCLMLMDRPRVGIFPGGTAGLPMRPGDSFRSDESKIRCCHYCRWKLW